MAGVREAGADAPDHRPEHERRTDRAQHQQLPDAVIRDQPFAQGVVEREKEDRDEIERNAETVRRRAAGRDRWGNLALVEVD